MYGKSWAAGAKVGCVGTTNLETATLDDLVDTV
jgi:hypothetical protein